MKNTTIRPVGLGAGTAILMTLISCAVLEKPSAAPVVATTWTADDRSFSMLSGIAKSKPIRREDYGRSPQPFWIPLKPFEQEGLAKLAEARRGNPYALLHLALMVGRGDQKTYKASDARITEWVVQHDVELSALAVPERAQHLLKLMHRDFLKGGYAYPQSNLVQLLKRGTYDSFSAALLYTILAAHFDVPTHGILLDGFALVAVGKKGRMVLDVTESSAVTWDASWFKTNAKKWAFERNLATPTLAAFRERKWVSNPTLVAYALHEEVRFSHDLPSLMNAKLNDITEEQARAAELVGYIGEDDEHLVHDRLNGYLFEVADLYHNDQATLARMLRVVRPNIEKAERSRRQRGVAFRNTLDTIKVFSYVPTINKGHLRKAHAGIGKIVRRLCTAEHPEMGDAADHALGVTHEIAVQWLSIGRKDKADATMKQNFALCRGAPWVKEDPSSLYTLWSSVYYRTKRYKDAKGPLSRCLSQVPDSDACKAQLAHLRTKHHID